MPTHDPASRPSTLASRLGLGKAPCGHRGEFTLLTATDQQRYSVAYLVNLSDLVISSDL